MRATVKNGIGVFHPQGFLDGNSVNALLSVEDIEATTKINADMVLVSLKRVVFFNRNGLDQFVKMFEKVKEAKHITVGFCDYDEKKYKTIQKFYENDMNFSLFKTIKIAELFSNAFANKNKNVLIWSDDKSQRTAIAIELHDRGHNPVVAQTKQDFLEKKEKKETYDVVVEDTFLGMMGQQVAARATANAIIYTVSGFLDNEITNKFNFEYHTNCLQIGFRLFIFDAYKVVSLNIHATNFFAKLATSAAEYNATIVFVGLSFDKTPESFKHELEDAGVMFFEKLEDILGDKELLKELGAASAASGKHKRTLTKQVVAKLPSFVKATVETLEMMTNAQAIKENADIDTLKISSSKNLIASSIGFYGDLDGIIALIFPLNIAKKSCELLIGEDTDDIDMILDTLGELVNIVGGKLKTVLSEEKISINITLPRTYNDIQDALEVIGDRKGVQVDLKFDNDHFTFFLTR